MLMLIRCCRVRVTVYAEIEVDAVPALVASASYVLAAAVAQANGTKPLFACVEDVEPPILLVLQILGRPMLFLRLDLFITFELSTVGDVPIYSLGRVLDLWRQSA